MHRVGKRVGGTLYVHRGALNSISSAVCSAVHHAEHLVAQVATGQQWNVCKVARGGGVDAITLLWYPCFDDDPHPGLLYCYRVDMVQQAVRRMDYTQGIEPILHRKELLVLPMYPGRAMWVALTAAESAEGLYADTTRIGTRKQWNALLASKGLRHGGHALVRVAP
jgi:hypothetical protein